MFSQTLLTRIAMVEEETRRHARSNATAALKVSPLGTHAPLRGIQEEEEVTEPKDAGGSGAVSHVPPTGRGASFDVDKVSAPGRPGRSRSSSRTGRARARVPLHSSTSVREAMHAPGLPDDAGRAVEVDSLLMQRLRSTAFLPSPEMVFRKESSDVSIIALELPGLAKAISGQTDLVEASQLIHEIHCRVEYLVQDRAHDFFKVCPLGSHAVLAIALNLTTELPDHQVLALEVAMMLYQAVVSARGWSSINVEPSCKIAIGSGPCVAVLLGRYQPITNLLGPAMSETQRLLESTSFGWCSMGEKIERACRGSSTHSKMDWSMQDIYSKGTAKVSKMATARLSDFPLAAITDTEQKTTPTCI